METGDSALIPYETKLPAELSAIEKYLDRIRAEWQVTPLVRRVMLLLPVDASSACQRLLNAAGHDLRIKIRIIGLDLAREAAQSFGLPPVQTDEQLEDYPTARLYDLAYRVGLLTRPEWRRLHRAYEIRRDLEHEDDEYEATPAELAYIFETAIDVVLAKQPVQVIRLQDIKEIVESDAPTYVSSDLLEDYIKAPPQRQAEIFIAVAFWSIDSDRPEIVRANCYRAIQKLVAITPHGVKIELAKKLETRIGRRPVDLTTARVAMVSGAFPFIHRTQQRAVIDSLLERFDQVKPDWRQHPWHGELLDDFNAAGGFGICPSGVERKIVRWMVECYVGEPGRSGTFGRNRAVFYSDTAASRIEKTLRDAPPEIKVMVSHIANEASTGRLIQVPEQQQRLQHLVQLTSGDTCAS